MQKKMCRLAKVFLFILQMALFSNLSNAQSCLGELNKDLAMWTGEDGSIKKIGDWPNGKPFPVGFEASPEVINRFMGEFEKSGWYDGFGRRNLEKVYARFLEKNSQFNSLTFEEFYSISRYVGNLYELINSYLRKQETRPIPPLIWDLIQVIVSGLGKLEANTYTGLVYRGGSLSPARIEEYRAAITSGEPIQEYSFFSTSRNSETAFPGNTKFEIESSRGVGIEGISNVNESEVLLYPYSKFKIIDVHLEGDRTIIKMKELAD